MKIFEKMSSFFGRAFPRKNIFGLPLGPKRKRIGTITYFGALERIRKRALGLITAEEYRRDSGKTVSRPLYMPDEKQAFDDDPSQNSIDVLNEITIHDSTKRKFIEVLRELGCSDEVIRAAEAVPSIPDEID